MIKNLIPTTVAVLMGLVIGTSGLQAQEKKKAPVPPEAAKLLDQMIKALGGEDAIKKVKTRVTKAKMEMKSQGISMEMKVTQKAPDKVLVEQSIPGLMEMQQGYDGKKGWAKDGIQGLREIKGKELLQVQQQASLYRELKMKTEYTELKVLPDVTEGDKKLKVLSGKNKRGELETFFFDAKTHLIAKMQQTLEMGPQGKVKVTISFDDYQDVDGMKLPFKSTVSNPAFEAAVSLSEVKNNVEVDDKVFSMPAN